MTAHWIKSISERLLSGSRTRRVVLYVAIDAGCAVFAIVAAVMLRFEDRWYEALGPVWPVIPIAMISSVGALSLFGLYRTSIRFANSTMLYRAVKAGSLASLLVAASLFALDADASFRGTILIFWGLLVGLPALTRIVFRDVLAVTMGSTDRAPVAIFGAGEAGVQLADALARSVEYRPIAFVDESRKKHGNLIRGLTVYGPEALEWLTKINKVKDVFIAIPSASRSRQRALMERISRYPVRVRVVPPLEDIASGRKHVGDLQRIEITDILKRDTVTPMADLFRRSVEGRSILVTGAGGSIGSELCRQIFRHRPVRLVLVESSEPALYSISQEIHEASLPGPGKPTTIVPILANACDQAHMLRVMKAWGTEVVFHAAAYKHVPIVEMNACEGVRNNVFGTLHCALAAADAGASTFILVSTDKAVRPTSVMGASKRFAELILQGLTERGRKPRYCIVRFGNVLDSSGSVVPVFKEQIEKGGPITVTHPEVTRYFMTIPEAANLVIQAGAMGHGGDVFLLDMGKPIKIDHLARHMVHLAGLEVRDDDKPDGDIEIAYVGLRAGEKLYEELLIGDNVVATEHPMIMRALEEKLAWRDIEDLLGRVERACGENDVAELRQILVQAVSGYRPGDEIFDWASGPQTGPALRVVPIGRRET